jgi:hypothetical protein
MGDEPGLSSTPTFLDQRFDNRQPAHPNWIATGQFQQTPPTPSSYTMEDPKPVYVPSDPYVSDYEPRRLSVDSLLAGPPGHLPQQNISFDQTSSVGSEGSYFETIDINGETKVFGIDRGEPDLDIRTNNLDREPDIEEIQQDAMADAYPASNMRKALVPLNRNTLAFAPGGYYAKPVQMRIPRSLLPLPDYLMSSRTNLLYFHHFLNHTARVLVPHDCTANPFRTILPCLSMDNHHLLNLLLAYSASHRARLLEQPEPSERIGTFLDDAFRALRLATADDSKRVSNSNLATAIMLCSLEIISPIPFDVPVPWQIHLREARDIILLRGGAKAVHKKDPVFHFLCRWFAYLDVLGSLSGQNEQPLFSGNYWSSSELGSDTEKIEDEFEIDCLLGFTSRCISILAKVAQLARKCDSERASPIYSDNNVSQHQSQPWQPSSETYDEAMMLLSELEDARTQTVTSCSHSHYDDEDMPPATTSEMQFMNEAFHWAGLVHLHRRVLGKESTHPDVQNAVFRIVEALKMVSIGGTAEAGLLFPIFTAGCDALRDVDKSYILGRVESMEKNGLTQVRLKYYPESQVCSRNATNLALHRFGRRECLWSRFGTLAYHGRNWDEGNSSDNLSCGSAFQWLFCSISIRDFLLLLCVFADSGSKWAFSVESGLWWSIS